MAAVVPVIVLSMLTLMILTVEGCVPADPGCMTYTTTPAVVAFFGNLNSTVVIIAIVVACIAAVVIILLVVWLCCWCWYRTAKDTEKVPRIIRRTVVVRQPQQQQQQVKKVIVQKPVPPPAPPPPPPPPPPKKTLEVDVCTHMPSIMHPSSEKIVVVQPVVAKPTSLMLTVSDGHNSTANGPVMTTCLEQPLKFTLTPEYAGHHAVSNLSVYERVSEVGHRTCNCDQRSAMSIPASSCCHHH